MVRSCSVEFEGRLLYLGDQHGERGYALRYSRDGFRRQAIFWDLMPHLSGPFSYALERLLDSMLRRPPKRGPTLLSMQILTRALV